MTVFDKLITKYQTFLKKYPNVLIQFLFCWVIFRLSGFLYLPLIVRLIIVLVSFGLILFFWGKIFPWVLNFLMVQFFLYFWLKILNNLTPYKKFGFFLFGFFVGLLNLYFDCYYIFLTKETWLYLNSDLKFYVPSVDFLCIFFFLLAFFKKFNEVILFPKIIDNFCLLGSENYQNFGWLSVIELLNWYIKIDLKVDIKIVNQLKLKNSYFTLQYFPLSKECFFIMKQLNVCSSLDIVSEVAERYLKKNLTEQEKYFLAKKGLEDLSLNSYKIKSLITYFIQESNFLNLEFYKFVFRGLLVSFVFQLFLLNCF